jgi:hypothetical protein
MGGRVSTASGAEGILCASVQESKTSIVKISQGTKDRIWVLLKMNKKGLLSNGEALPYAKQASLTHIIAQYRTTVDRFLPPAQGKQLLLLICQLPPNERGG